MKKVLAIMFLSLFALAIFIPVQAVEINKATTAILQEDPPKKKAKTACDKAAKSEASQAVENKKAASDCGKSMAVKAEKAADCSGDKKMANKKMTAKKPSAEKKDPSKK